MQNLLLPIIKGRGRFDDVRRLNGLAKELNDIRNGIAHQWHFCVELEAKQAIEQAREFIEGLVGHYQPGFALVDQKPSSSKKQ